MKSSRRAFLQWGGAAAAALWAAPPLVQARADVATFPHFPRSVAPPPFDPVWHFLSRTSYGAAPAEYERCTQMGIAAYLDEQLYPELLMKKGRALKAQLRRLPLLRKKRQRLYAMKSSGSKCWQTLVRARVAYAVHSPAQLLERMVEFWSDHFNVSAGDYQPDQLIYQHQILRQHALGNFHDLLLATAQSPAMLYYLDNYVNRKKKPNENYARELMELHTLGVDGGYTEEDVKEVARALTGWTVSKSKKEAFAFDYEEHDKKEKVVLGQVLVGGRGIEDGLDVLRMLADHPSTAQFIARKLCRKFASDTPPASLVASTAAVFTQTGGDIRAVLRHLFLAPEFGDCYLEKLRRPFDYYAGAARATGAQFRDFWYLWYVLTQLGQPPFEWPAPNGYPEAGAAWITTNGLLARWNSSIRLTMWSKEKRKEKGDPLTPFRKLIGTPHTAGELVDAVSRAVFGRAIDGDFRKAFLDYASESGEPHEVLLPDQAAARVPEVFALMLISPLYQWR